MIPEIRDINANEVIELRNDTDYMLIDDDGNANDSVITDSESFSFSLSPISI
jgi:hypothetical protein